LTSASHSPQKQKTKKNETNKNDGKRNKKKLMFGFWGDRWVVGLMLDFSSLDSELPDGGVRVNKSPPPVVEVDH